MMNEIDGMKQEFRANICLQTVLFIYWKHPVYFNLVKYVNRQSSISTAIFTSAIVCLHLQNVNVNTETGSRIPGLTNQRCLVKCTGMNQ